MRKVAAVRTRPPRFACLPGMTNIGCSWHRTEENAGSKQTARSQPHGTPSPHGGQGEQRRPKKSIRAHRSSGTSSTRRATSWCSSRLDGLSCECGRTSREVIGKCAELGLSMSVVRQVSIQAQRLQGSTQRCTLYVYIGHFSKHRIHVALQSPAAVERHCRIVGITLHHICNILRQCSI